MNNSLDLICIIDDDPIYTFAVRKLLKINNFSDNQLVFKNGKEALDGLITMRNKKDNLPDVILLDINMPIMDGWEFLEAFKISNFNKDIPIFITSSSVDNLDIRKATTNTLVNGYISKPLNNQSLQEIKRKCL